jgi:hypothetical protein
MSSAFTNHAQETLAVYHAAYQAGWKDCYEKYVAPKHATAEFTEQDALNAAREFDHIVGLCDCQRETGVQDCSKGEN